MYHSKIIKYYVPVCTPVCELRLGDSKPCTIKLKNGANRTFIIF